MSEKLNPSPKIPSGEKDVKIITQTLGVSYGTLSPNPNFEDKLIEGEHGVGQPTNPNNPPKELKV